MNENFPTAAGEVRPVQVQIQLPALVPKVTYAVIGFTVFAYLLQILSVAVLGYAVNDIDWLEILGARINGPIRAGEIWRFITPAFLYGSTAHIFFNVYALVSISSFMERQLGHPRFLSLYFLSAFSGNVFSFLLGREDGLSVGASTAIFGLIAAEGVFFYQNRELFGGQARKALNNTAFIIIVNLLIGLSPGIDNWGHLGGLFGGALFSWLAGTRWTVTGSPPQLQLEDRREIREVFTGAGIVLMLFGMLAIWGMFFK